ncbi:MAG: DUF512 domain-containing protein [Actinomycetia bacterium]|nr:DUF512 domain-containing protein [Actinomycetes bacterium]
MSERRYGDAVSGGGVVAAVDVGSPAYRAGIRPADRVTHVDGEALRDVLDWQWFTQSDEFTVTFLRDGRAHEVGVRRVPGSTLGLRFEGAVFDEVRQCVNSCAFCFVAQLPPGLRPSLYVRDDDYRLSFLYGNFITLSNLEEAEIDRIVTQRLSPLYVSLHAVDPQVRRSLIACTVEDTTMRRMSVLAEHGIEMHVQVVAVPGVNDGPILRETLEWAQSLATVRSVGVVPAGHTAYDRRSLRSYSSEESAALLEDLRPLQQRMRANRGVTWVYAADEFYLSAGREVPAAEYYDDFVQYENGIGMVRAFMDDLDAMEPVADVFATVVTGTLFAPVLESRLRRAGLERIRVLGVQNALLGGNVSVAGLLGGKDLIEAIRDDTGPGPYLVPGVVVNSDGLLLDDVPASELERGAGKPVMIAGTTASDLVDVLRRV